jgi:hypothetical protein
LENDFAGPGKLVICHAPEKIAALKTENDHAFDSRYYPQPVHTR